MRIIVARQVRAKRCGLSMSRLLSVNRPERSQTACPWAGPAPVWFQDQSYWGRTMRMSGQGAIMLAVVMGSAGCRTTDDARAVSDPVALEFASEVLTTGRECNVSLTPDGEEFYFSRADSAGGRPHVLSSKLEAGRWQDAVPTNFSDDRFSDFDPFVSPDGSRLYFASSRPETGTEEKTDHDLWFAERTADGWSKPRRLGGSINTEAKEGYPTVTIDGALLYFSERPGGSGLADVYRARLGDDGGASATTIENLRMLNTARAEVSPYVAPDGSYVIFYRMAADGGDSDLYVSYDADGTWTPPRRLRDVVNTSDYEMCPTVSPDGQYLFFARFHDRRSQVYRITLEAAGIRER